MSKQLMVTNGLIKWTPEIFCAVRFTKSRAQIYKTCVRLASRATYYVEGEEDGVLTHYCAFAKTPKDAKLAYTFLERVRKLKDHICFINGEPEKITWRILNIINCYAGALKVKNKEAYCHHTFEFDEGVEVYSPCKDLSGFLFQIGKMSLEDIAQAFSEENRQVICPLFNLSKLKKLPTRYWD